MRSSIRHHHRLVATVTALLSALTALVLAAPEHAGAAVADTPATNELNAVSYDSVALGDSYGCAVDPDGALYCWGENGDGQVGDGTTVDRSAPVQVVGLANDVTSVSVMAAHTCAVADGDVWCWGWNMYGQLGDGTTTTSTAPRQVSLPGPAVSVGVGWFSTCALLDDGDVWCWGRNESGQLGVGTTTDSLVPVKVPSLSGIEMISVGKDFACAVDATGTASCWGLNDQGQLGDGSTTNRLAPVPVAGITERVTAISANELTVCVLLDTADVMCWGANDEGQFGTGQSGNSVTTAAAAGPFPGDVVAISNGTWVLCVLLADSTAWCSGANWSGQLGDGTWDNSSVPLQVTGVSGEIRAVVAGYETTCAVIADGALDCWGINNSGALALGTPDTWTSPEPTPVAGFVGPALGVSAADQHTCGVTASGDVMCWGSNDNGRLGDGTTTQRWTPVPVIGLAGPALEVSAGGRHSCVVNAAGRVWCWGDNNAGQLGDGTTTTRLTPVEVTGLPSGATAVSAGTETTCAVVAGDVWCWGDNSHLELGVPSPASSSTPVAVTTPFAAGTTLDVEVGWDSTCAVDTAGQMACWGRDEELVIPVGNPFDSTNNAPTLVTNLNGATVSAVSLGRNFGCAVTSAGSMCWGNSQAGQVGAGTTNQSFWPPTVTRGNQPMLDISAGGAFTCAITATGSAQCWGNAMFGRLGDGVSTNSTAVPVTVSAIAPTAIDLGTNHACAVDGDGSPKCWGSNSLGAVANGFVGHALRPVTTLARTRAVPVATDSTPPPLAPPPPPTALPTPERITAASRVDAAVAMSSSVFAPGVEVVYLATTATAADAVVAGAASGTARGPVLLVERSSIPNSTALELRRLKPQRIVVVGGPAAVDDVVTRAAADYALLVERVAGVDRYATAVALSQRVHRDEADMVFLASGDSGVDAAAGVAAAGSVGAPLLYVRSGSVPQATADELRRLSPSRIVVLGGPSAVSEAVLSSLGASGATVERVAGADRFATSAQVAARFWPGVATTVYLVPGEQGSVSGALVAAAAVVGAPVLLVRGSCIPSSVDVELRRLSPRRVVVVSAGAQVPQALGVCL